MSRQQKLVRLLMLAALAVSCVSSARAQLVIPGADGSDLDFSPMANTVVDLSLATTGTWDMLSPNPGDGVYDPVKWAVVFKYSSVNIPPGVTVSFANHPSRAPVVWIVSGDVTIAGTVNVSAPSRCVSIEPGPGGFRGGANGVSGSIPGSGGFGPGGARHGSSPGGPGSYGSRIACNFNDAGQIYGTSQIVPLLGGSGGATRVIGSHTEGAGGGAILVVATGTVALTGAILANGGDGCTTCGGGGSGGAIRLVADVIAGSGALSAIGGIGGNCVTVRCDAFRAANGRIRLEANTATNSLSVFPTTVAVPPENPPLVFPPAAAPTARIISIAGLAAPSDPTANIESAGADIITVGTASAEVIIETMNFDLAGTVTVRVVPKNGNDYTVQAVSVAGGDFMLSTWAATVSLPTNNFVVMQVRAVSP